MLRPRLFGLGVIAVSIALGVPESPAFAQPAPDQNARTIKARTTTEVEAAFSAIDAAMLGEAYTAHGVKDPSWDDLARTFLADAAKYYSANNRFVSYNDLTTRARTLRELRCTDPMVLTMGAMLESEAAKGQASVATHRERLRHAISTSETVLPPQCAAQAHDVDWRLSGQLQDPDGQGAAIAHAVSAVLRGFESPNPSPDYQRALLRKVAGRIMSSPPGSLAGVEAAVAKSNGASRWGNAMLRGLIEHRLAWAARGDGTANTVTPDGWKAFELHEKRAAQYFIEAYQAVPENPESATMMIRVAMAGYDPTGQSVETWCRRATDVQLDHTPALDATMWALRPRWGGSHRAMLDFGRSCAATDRYDTTAPYQMVSAVLAVMDDAGDTAAPFQIDGVYDAAASVLRRYASRADGLPNARAAKSFRSTLAAMSRCAGRYADGRAVIDELKGDLDPEGMKRFRDPVWVARECYAFSTPAQAALRRALEDIGPDAVELADRAVQQCDQNGDPRGFEAVSSYRAAIKTLAASLDGPVNLASPELQPLWHQADRPWTGTAAGWTADIGDAGEYVLFPIGVGPDFELAVTVKFDPAVQTGRAGLVFHWEWAQEREARYRTLTISPGEPAVRVGNEFGGMTPGTRVARAGTYELAITVQGGEAVASVNGVEVLKGTLPPHPGWAPGARVGLGASGKPGTVEFSNVKLRSLRPAP